MARIAGITTEKDTKGNIVRVTIDVKKHREIMAPLLAQLVAKEDDEFEKEWMEAKQKGSTLLDVFDRLEAKVKSWEWTK